jgi:uracil-DNA glycosylase family 4
MDSREELAADIRAWLEWQKICGTDVWKVDDISVWDACSSAVLHPYRSKENRIIEKKTAIVVPPPVEKKKSEQSQQHESPPQERRKRIEKKQYDLPKWWKSVYEKKKSRSTFDVSRVPPGGDGVQRAFAFRDIHCSGKECRWGGGRADAPVVLIEGYRKHLAGAGLKMLGDMRTNMLRLSKNNLYWIPIKREIGCGHCDTMSLAQLNAIQPKAILVLGFAPLDLLRIHDRESAEKGSEFLIELNATSVPAICTYHPMALLEESHNKEKARNALRTFREILNRLHID